MSSPSEMWLSAENTSVPGGKARVSGDGMTVTILRSSEALARVDDVDLVDLVALPGLLHFGTSLLRCSARGMVVRPTHPKFTSTS